MKSTTLTRGAIFPAAVALALTLGACSSDGSSDAGSASGSESSSPATSSGMAEETGPTSDQPFGAACSQVPAEGAGSFAGMSTAPVASAASSNPVLSTLVQAVTAANLVDSLNAQEDVTVLAPANPAFAAIPPDQLGAVLADVPQLTSILTHHVIQGRLAPDELAGEHTTLNNDTVTIEGSGEEFTISGEQTITTQPASVICGNVQTANATVYIIDQVLAPEAAA
ncbi:fasciclin domain-containing protein [Blastococcus sp. SYSU D00669]